MLKVGSFTLIELLIVISIMGIIGSIAQSAFSSYLKKARVNTVLQIATTMKESILNYRTSHSTFPASANMGIPPDPANPGHGSLGDPSFFNQSLSQFDMNDYANISGCANPGVLGNTHYTFDPAKTGINLTIWYIYANMGSGLDYGCFLMGPDSANYEANNYGCLVYGTTASTDRINYLQSAPNCY